MLTVLFFLLVFKRQHVWERLDGLLRRRAQGLIAIQHEQLREPPHFHAPRGAFVGRLVPDAGAERLRRDLRALT